MQNVKAGEERSLDRRTKEEANPPDQDLVTREKNDTEARRGDMDSVIKTIRPLVDVSYKADAALAKHSKAGLKGG